MNDYPFPIHTVRAMDLQPDGTYLLWVDCVLMPGRYADCYAAQDAGNLLDAETLVRLYQDTLARGDAAITHVDVLRAALAAERGRCAVRSETMMANQVTATMPLGLTPEMLRAVKEHHTTKTDDRDEWHRRLGWLLCAWDVLLQHSARVLLTPIVGAWQPIETAPRDGTPVLGWCVHAADPYWIDDGKRLTIYGGHTEGLSHVEDGPHVVVWGGAFDDGTWEAPGARMPDWWFRHGSGFEETANPTHWMPLPAPIGGAGTQAALQVAAERRGLSDERVLMIGRRAVDKCPGTEAQHLYIAREVERAHGIAR